MSNIRIEFGIFGDLEFRYGSFCFFVLLEGLTLDEDALLLLVKHVKILIIFPRATC